MTDFPLLDGTVVDVDREFAPAFTPPDADKTKRMDAGAWFMGDQLPPTLTYSTDNGPTSPTFTDYSTTFRADPAPSTTGGVTLTTGTTNVGDSTVLTGPSFDITAVSSFRVFLADAWISDTKARGYVMLADADSPGDSSNGIYLSWADIDTIQNGLFMKAKDSGTNTVEHDNQDLDCRFKQTAGFMIENNGGGPTLHWQIPGLGKTTGVIHWDSVADIVSQVGTTSLTLHIGVETADTSTDRRFTVGNIYTEIVP